MDLLKNCRLCFVNFLSSAESSESNRCEKAPSYVDQSDLFGESPSTMSVINEL